jgi:hypothetical protein
MATILKFGRPVRQPVLRRPPAGPATIIPFLGVRRERLSARPDRHERKGSGQEPGERE